MLGLAFSVVPFGGQRRAAVSDRRSRADRGRSLGNLCTAVRSRGTRQRISKARWRRDQLRRCAGRAADARPAGRLHARCTRMALGRGRSRERRRNIASITDEAAGVQIAAFPGMTLPTASHGMGAGQRHGVAAGLGAKGHGPWSVFGGGGYAVNPGSGNRDYWTGGVAVTRQVRKRLLVGAEADRQGADTDRWASLDRASGLAASSTSRAHCGCLRRGTDVYRRWGQRLPYGSLRSGLISNRLSPNCVMELKQ